jgi:hypothetical protein
LNVLTKQCTTPYRLPFGTSNPAKSPCHTFHLSRLFKRFLACSNMLAFKSNPSASHPRFNISPITRPLPHAASNTRFIFLAFPVANRSHTPSKNAASFSVSASKMMS